ncbi:MAG: metal ABC transporter substrate-binding protein [Chloroflexi bacterium]|nr:metal ABC transporter substrate-binding protein [Chloroflexota bacterium]MBI3764628.1 metal ABC transporter substrate-binding protein [Chloroflexota bacterium]
MARAVWGLPELPKMMRWLTPLVVLSLLLTACSASPPATPDGRLKVVATFSVIGDFARVVGGDQIELTTLVGAGRDTHTFDPNPTDGVALARASLILENGLGFETWLDDLYASSGSRGSRIVVTKGIEPRMATAGGGAQAADPHVWHAVANAIQMIGNIRDALGKADPAHAQTYQANAEAYVAQLQELDAWVFAEVNALPEGRRKLVTTHDTFGYFAQRYGFKIVGTVLPASTEGASPSAQQVAALVEAVKAQGVPAVFAENVSSNAILQQVANEAGVKIVGSLYTDALGPPGSDGETYLKMMRRNVTTIVAALR